MNNLKLKNDFIIFEKNYYFTELSDNNFYALLDNPDISSFIVNCIEKNHSNDFFDDKIFIKNFNDLCRYFEIKDINFQNFEYFKSIRDILCAYIFLFLIKTFSFKLKNSKIQKNEYELLLIRDFFLDRNDFTNIFLDYLFKFFLFNEIIYKKTFSYNKKWLRVFSLRLIEICSKNKIITLTDLKINYKHYKILVFNLFSIPFIPEVVFYTKKFEVYVRFNIDPYIYNTHFYSIVSITKQATYSNSTFKVEVDQIHTLTQRSFYIDKNLLLNSFKILLESLSLNEDTDLVELCSKYSSKIQKFLNEKDIESLKIYHSKLSKILTLIRIHTVLNLNFSNKELFLPFMFCFRGRIYELGNLSFTFYKEFRYCLYSGFYNKEEEKFHPINSQINNTIDENFHLFKKYYWFENLNIIRKRACIWLFIGLGVTKKTELGKKVHISAFILKGLELWDQKEQNSLLLSDYEKIEFNYLLFLIEELKNSKILKKWIFWKDATASCFQHLLLILGERDKSSYSICNLDSTEYWYDPYSYLIHDFFEKKKNNSNSLYYNSKFISIFSRKKLKKIIMTESYGAGFKKLSSYFFLDLNLNEFSIEEKNFILETWEDFFNYLSNENVLFAQSSKAINRSFTEKKLVSLVNPDNSEVDYSCFVIQITQNEYYVNKKRHTYQTKNITTNFDNEQFHTSLRANFVQTRDAALARKYINYTKMWTVHDCFSIDFLNISYMVSVINELMNGEFYDLKINLKGKKPIFSIFIIL